MAIFPRYRSLPDPASPVAAVCGRVRNASTARPIAVARVALLQPRVAKAITNGDAGATKLRRHASRLVHQRKYARCSPVGDEQLTRGLDRARRCRLLADHLDADLSLPWAVELGEDDRLEAAEGQLTVVHADGDVAAEQGRAKVRVRVAALAIGDPRIVVAIAVALGHQLLHQRAEVVDQRTLELVDEQRACRV